MRIDVHAHLFSHAYIDGLRRVFGKDSSPAGQDAQRLIKWMSTDPRMTDIEGRLAEMEKWGVGMQVLSVPFHGALVKDQSAAADLTHMANDMILQRALAQRRAECDQPVARHDPEAGRHAAEEAALDGPLNAEQIDRTEGHGQQHAHDHADRDDVGIGYVGHGEPGPSPMPGPRRSGVRRHPAARRS